jgi:SAM-dependent methyltransferase
MTSLLGPGSRGPYWDDRYEQIGADQVSWYQARPTISLELIDQLRIDPSTSVIDVGGGSSTLVDELLVRGFDDVTVLDVSDAALDVARARLFDRRGVTWLHTDVLSWTPGRQWRLWHDRAVFHFLTEPADRHAYLQQLAKGLAAGGAFIIATFAPDGPVQCSGLPVSRYDADGLADVITTAVAGATILSSRDEDHTTPAGATQPFTWIAGVVGAG